MTTAETNVITGAFSYTGKYITGTYRLQPIYVEDMADLVVLAGQMVDNTIIDAVGPDIFTYEELVRLIALKLQRNLTFIHVDPQLGFSLAKLVEPFVGDVLITRDEVTGLMANLLISQELPTGHTHLNQWLDSHIASIGRAYASELSRHYRYKRQ